MKRTPLALCCAGTWLLATEALAADGVYGRLAGDLDVGIGAGSELDRHGARAALWLDAHYLSMLGAYVQYADALADRGLVRNVSLGVEIRPAFVPRWSEDLEQGPGLLDLMLDSVGIGLGACFAQPRQGNLGSQTGLQATLGFGVPLMGAAWGPWLGVRGLLRWPETRGDPTAAAIPTGLLTLEWHLMAETGLLPE
jgi:hypothetical protein